MTRLARRWITPRLLPNGSAIRSSTRAFIAHGRRDPVMELGFAQRARDLLRGGGLEVTYRESDVGHQIDPPHPADAAEWLR